MISIPSKSKIDRTLTPVTRASIAADLRALGVREGETLLVHSALSAFDWIVGGPEAVVLGLLDALSEDGTLVAPAFTSDNSEPSNWRNPPVPEGWWQSIREHTPAFNSGTPTRMMGLIADTVRTHPAAQRSDHPQNSFAAIGTHAAVITAAPTPLDAGFGDGSPLGALYELVARVLLLGVGHGNNTSLHLSEHRADYPKPTIQEGAAVLVDGVRQWVAWEGIDYDDDDFETIGAAFEQAMPGAINAGQVGGAPARLMSLCSLVDFGATWMTANRGK
ncbi:MAG: AAC(3) family N-acetyltransferase [Chloroflexota bacterium]